MPYLSQGLNPLRIHKFTDKRFELIKRLAFIFLHTLKKFSSQSESAQNAIELPICKHSFHSDCLMKWLEKSSNCPLCRYDLPTDDADYERYKKQKKREKVREQELEDLHSSMYS